MVLFKSDCFKLESNCSFPIGEYPLAINLKNIPCTMAIPTNTIRISATVGIKSPQYLHNTVGSNTTIPPITVINRQAVIKLIRID